MEIAVVQDPQYEDRFAGLCECGFMTSQWPTAKIATERIRQHGEEHDSGTLMEVLSDFRQRMGLVVNSATKLVEFPEGAKVVTVKKKGD